MKYITARVALLFVFVLNSSKWCKLWVSHTHKEKQGGICNCLQYWWWLLAHLAKSQEAKLGRCFHNWYTYFCTLLLFINNSGKNHIWYVCGSSQLTKGEHYLFQTLWYFIKWGYLCSVLWVRKCKFREVMCLNFYKQRTEGRSLESMVKGFYYTSIASITKEISMGNNKLTC